MNKKQIFKKSVKFIKKLSFLFLTGSLVFNVPPCTAFAENSYNSATIYVSPNGGKDGDGSIDNPYNSLKAAKNAVREIKKTNNNIPITVYLRGGKYNECGVTFESEDSGDKNAPITYSAYKDEIPVFSGSVSINTSDFKPVSKEIQKILPKQSRDYVGVVDLKKKGINHITKYTGTSESNYRQYKNIDEVETSFYFNGREQNIAKWPNGSDEWASIKSAPSTSDSFAVYYPDRIYNWSTAKDPVITGYLRVDWAYQRVVPRKIMPDTGIILFNAPLSGGIDASGKWAITNLLEELDVPGEYYVDSDNLKLYFYPPYSTVGVDMEIACGEQKIFDITNAKYISFNKISFEKNRNSAVELNNSSNIEFNSCTFKDISLKGIVMRMCEDITVDGCNFTNIGSTGVLINPDDFEGDGHYNKNLKPQNVVVNNCDFYDIATKSRTYTGAVRVEGVGNTVSRCRMHECKSGVIYFRGNDHKITGNEVYNVLKVARDQGAVYHGRNLAHRGQEIAYNYFHDFDTVSQKAGYVTAIYLDDLLGGVNSHHNIFYNIEEPVSYTGGSDNKFDDNIIVSCESAGRFASGGYGNSSFKNAYSNFVKLQIPNVATIDDYGKYKNLNSLFFLNEWPSLGLSIKNNLFYNNKTAPRFSDDIKQMLNADDNIISYDEKYKDMFVSPDDGNYTIKPDAQIGSGYETLKDITMDKIGLYKSDTREQTVIPLGGFRQYYPYNHSDGVNGEALYFQWDKSFGADYYIIEIALDKDFENIVYSANVPFNYASVKNIENSGDTYYWRVYAMSDGYGCKEKLLSSDEYMVFKTSVNSNVDISALESEIAKCDEFILNITEGNENGQFAAGTKAELMQINESAKELIAQKRVSQFAVDDMTLTIKKAIEDAVKTIPREYADISEYISGTWMSVNSNLSVNVSDGTLNTHNTDEVNMAVATCTSKAVPKNALLSFDMECDASDAANAWKGIAICDEKSAGNLIWSGGKKGYLIVIKANQLEFQVWDGTSNKILETVDNPFIDGTMNKVNFGILSFNGGQRIILEVNGKTISDIVNTENVVNDDLYLSFYDAQFFKAVNNTGVKVKNRTAGESVISYVAEQPQIMDAAQLDGVIKSAGGSGELRVKNNTAVSKDKIDGTKTMSFDIKPDLSGEIQGIVFSSNNNCCYKLALKDGRVSLIKETDGKQITLSSKKTDIINNQSWNNIKIARKNYVDTVNLQIIINGTKVIDCIDEYPITQNGGFGAYSLSDKEIVVKAQ